MSTMVLVTGLAFIKNNPRLQHLCHPQQQPCTDGQPIPLWFPSRPHGGNRQPRLLVFLRVKHQCLGFTITRLVVDFLMLPHQHLVDNRRLVLLVDHSLRRHIRSKSLKIPMDSIKFGTCATEPQTSLCPSTVFPSITELGIAG